ncbi:hypothetical protein H112_01190 [Trichophyton rubrum D6]|uniref:Uncharacterized protein n=2 Tax=Trichophyton TaxID=5550 RepID=A0A022WDB6_TRIRU|nr:hypothetical protein H100_01183 [Trichophyton rubrum MR850]EZF45745.1 hypothetical protein H102_01180 [Trichophyton rubrum CBS 100081]EZF56319.1 hypothetical protein H103_01187 [Trichophyton rubrum CBS 288.86]EZF67066.1 hypothetical protein H104_01173 [Trichophyton rubrum CBS 289.86]EZF77715.1 hypothetical protein H105_01193 [Trichophyton soudanense CBS 452.61]EZF88247.1 hypothetical protein H110_01190 [Trichophyton rubrum MR1448]EZG20647.1 hypothetical protein H107_01238 [Trichophyton rub
MPVNYPLEDIYLKGEIALIHETDSRDSTLISLEQSNRACAITGQPGQPNISPSQAKPRPRESARYLCILPTMCKKLLYYRCGAIETIFSRDCNCSRKVGEEHSRLHCGICSDCQP